MKSLFIYRGSTIHVFKESETTLSRDRLVARERWVGNVDGACVYSGLVKNCNKRDALSYCRSIVDHRLRKLA